MGESITIVTMTWQGIRGYTLAQAEAVAAAVAKAATFPYRFVAITDERLRRSTAVEVMPMPDAAQQLCEWHAIRPSEYPANLPKLWLFSPEAQALGARIFYLDADSLVICDLAPLVAYEAQAPCVVMTLLGKLSSGMFCLRTAAMHHIWSAFLAHGMATFAADQCHGSDQGWLRYLGLHRTYPVWDNEAMGIYQLKSLERVGGPSSLPKNARIVHPTGKVKPWHPAFLSRHPWAQEYYPWPR